MARLTPLQAGPARQPGAPDRQWPALAESTAAAWFTMAAFAYAVPQVLYRRTRAEWMLPLAPFLRAIALPARPCVAVMSFLQSLVELANQEHAED